jgi:hypothetical protein
MHAMGPEQGAQIGITAVPDGKAARQLRAPFRSIDNGLNRLRADNRLPMLIAKQSRFELTQMVAVEVAIEHKWRDMRPPFTE